MCNICKDDFLENEIIKMIPCTHRYHKECIEEWLRRNSVCPMCRFKVN